MVENDGLALSELPHNPRCACRVCSLCKFDISYESRRLHLYERATSMDYIRNTFAHPFKAAVDHSADLKKASHSTNIHRKSYAELYREMSTMLKKEMEKEEVDIDNLLDIKKEINEEPAILRKLLDQENIEVITQFKVQHWLNVRWEAEVSERKVTGRIILYLMAWFLPAISFFGAFNFYFAKVPKLRWHSHLISHLCFFALLLGRLFWDENGTSLRSGRFSNVFYFEAILIAFIISHLTILIFRIAHRGFKSFMRDWWNWVEVCIVINGINFVVANVNIEVENQYGLPMNINRRHIPAADHAYLSEFSLSLLLLLMVARLAYFVQMTSRFGKFIVAVSQCAREYLRSLLVLFLFFMGYAFAIYGVLHPFATTPEERSKNLIKNNGFQVYSDNFFETLSNLYWNLLCLIDEGYGQIHAGFAGPNQEPVQPFLSIVFAKFLMASFYVFVVVALLNIILTLMIMQAESYKTQGDDNWAFARARIIIDYFNYEMAAPPPFTVILLPVLIYKVLKIAFRRCPFRRR